jgi:hypothetical protein
VKDDARRAVAALLVAIAGVAAAFAGVAAASHPGWLIACIVIAVVAAGLAVAVELPDVRALLEGRLRLPRLGPPPDRAPEVELPAAPAPVFTGRWRYTSDGHEARAAMMAMDSVMPGTGFRLQPGDRPPWVRFIVLLPCSQIGPDTEPAQLGKDFLQFLLGQPMIPLVDKLTRHERGARWTRYATNSAGAVQAVLTPGEEEEAVASARLELPDGTRRYFHDFASAVLKLHFEPPAETANPPLPAGPDAWNDRLRWALDLPNALDGFLTDQLGLTTSGAPQVVLGFRLDAPHDLAELIDVTDLHELPGGQHGRQAIGYLIADPDGVPPADVVERAIDHVLMYGLQSERR